MSSMHTRVAGALLLLLASGAPLAAQARLFPRVPSFELPEASPRVHGLVGRLFSARKGDSQFGREAEAEVGLGENFPVLALRRGPRPITLGFGSQVYGRFSLGDSKSAQISNDWVVGLNTTAALGRWELTAEVYHESSHLGDEYRDRFDATRLDWTREVAAGWASWRAGPWRLTGELSYALIDQLRLPRPGAALAVDFRSRPVGTLLGGQVRPVGGVYFEGAAATDWRVSTSAKLGIALVSDGRELGIALIAHDGLSTQRQFFRKESRYIGAELRFDL
ncbi:MAG TPA: DUF1207 domain-containing protein [Gemmatimonadales bacterium]|jgi:Protein of unknown function (DUF1207)|nr:DUF1207 domain-containing protein [Gemmatimonadales bacterium]